MRSASTRSIRWNRRLDSFRFDHPGVRGACLGRLDADLAQPVELQPHVVVGVEVVDADHLVPLIDQPPRHVVADEAGRARHQDLHDRSILLAARTGARSRRVDATDRSGHLRSAMVIRRTAYSRSGLVGNPSDIFGGKVISLLLDAFRAQATVYESPLADGGAEHPRPHHLRRRGGADPLPRAASGTTAASA